MHYLWESIFEWINMDNLESMSNIDFKDHYGAKLHETAWKDCCLLKALYTLMGSDWKGDKVIFMGDYSTSRDWIKYLDLDKCRLSGFNNFDELLEVEKKVAFQFVNCDEEEFSDPPEYYHLTYDDIRRIGTREFVYYRYVINEDKKIYIDRENEILGKLDMFPLLMTIAGYDVNDDFIGMWAGDFINVDNTVPGDEYRNATEELYNRYLEWRDS
ncbi:MAG: hypothetical protein ACI4WM_09225 [Erysipelotrichaceae bacterium]